MFVALSKILPLFIYPAGLACLLALGALLFHRRRTLSKFLLGAALLVVWITGTPWLPMTLVRSLEMRHRPADIPRADAIVVLGGGTNSAMSPRPTVEVSEAGDRTLYGAKLFKEGKASNILVSGGMIAWLGVCDPGAQDMSEILTWMGVPKEAIWVESRSRNTHENAIYSAEILAKQGTNKVLLVTSAMHMPRALATFTRAGVDAIPAPTDFAITDADWAKLFDPDPLGLLVNLVPQAEHMSLFSRALKEYLGLAVYRIKGWL